MVATIYVLLGPMPILLNPRYEMAAQAMAAGKNQRDAYTQAGFSYKPASAVRFFKRPDIVERVQELVQAKYDNERKSQEIATQEAGIDKSWILKRLKYLTDISLQKREIKKDGVVVGHGAMDGQTAVKCLTLAAQIGGHLVQRHEVGMPGDFQRMSDDELDSALAEQARALGLPEIAVDRLLTLRSDKETAQ